MDPLVLLVTLALIIVIGVADKLIKPLDPNDDVFFYGFDDNADIQVERSNRSWS